MSTLVDATLKRDLEEEPSSASSLGQKKPKNDIESEIRRSNREKTSTLIHVDGYAVKKQNNYVLKGGSYEHGFAVDDGPKKIKPNVPKIHKPPPKPRKVSQQELQYKQTKGSVDSRILAKSHNREIFFKENLEALEPFLHPKVLGKLQLSNGDAHERTLAGVGMQPESITAEMRDYQLDGLSWMSKMYQQNVGCILGDEMGLVCVLICYFCF
jgi:SNF2 family DNA or RNA helicase